MSAIQAVSRDSVKICGLLFTREAIEAAQLALNEWKPSIDMQPGVYLITPTLYYRLRAEGPDRHHNHICSFAAAAIVRAITLGHPDNGAYRCLPGQAPRHGYITKRGFEQNPCDSAYTLATTSTGWMAIQITN